MTMTSPFMKGNTEEQYRRRPGAKPLLSLKTTCRDQVGAHKAEQGERCTQLHCTLSPHAVRGGNRWYRHHMGAHVLV